MSQASRTDIIQNLRRRLLQVHKAQRHGPVTGTGLPGLDRLLPHNGIPAGSVIECVSSVAGSSATVVALQCIRQLLNHPGALAVIDPAHQFCPVAVASAGISLDRLLLIRPLSEATDPLQSRQARLALLWSLEQTVHCSGVRAVLCWFDRASTTVFRRLQLAAEFSGVCVFLMRPASSLATASWADMRLLFEAVPTSCHRIPVVSVQVIQSRHATLNEGAVQLRIDYETGVVSEISQLAGSATACSDIG